MKIARVLTYALALATSTLVARADTFSIFGSVYGGSDAMGFKVTSLENGGSVWWSAAPCCGPTVVVSSFKAQKTTFEFEAFAWQGPGFAEATGPWGTTTNLGGSIRVSGIFWYSSSLTGSPRITVPVVLVGDLQAFDNNGHLLGTLNFKRHGLATLTGEREGDSVNWLFANVDFPKVPEPSSYLLVGSGLIAMLRVYRRSKRRQGGTPGARKQ